MDQQQGEILKLRETKKILDVSRTVIDDSKFEQVSMDRVYFNDISAKSLKIVNANLSDLEIEDAQLGGAYIHNIGIPPEGHPTYNPDAKHRGLRFEDCALNNTTITDCNLSDVVINDCNLSNAVISDCNLSGMTINGIAVEALLKAYKG